MDWTAIGSIGAIVVSAAGTYLVYRRGKEGDQALSLSQGADRRSKETETNLATQGSIIDQLQEEVTRYRAELNAKAGELDEKRHQLDEARAAVNELRVELVHTNADLDAAKIIIAGLDRTVEALQIEVASLRRLVDDHVQTIARLELTIIDLRDEAAT